MASGRAASRAVTAAAIACLLLGSLGPADAARGRRRRRAAARPAAARARSEAGEPSAPRDSLNKPVVPLFAEPEATTIRTLTGRGAPDLTYRYDLPAWARGGGPPPAEEPVPGPSEDERVAAAGARARSAFVLLTLVLAGFAIAWVPDLIRAAGDGPPPMSPD